MENKKNHYFIEFNVGTKKFTTLICFLLILLVLSTSGCYSAKFTSENVMKLKVGMSDKDVVAIFGNPRTTEAGTCGQGLGKPWTCITWKYGEYYPKLTFGQQSDGKLSLNSWQIR